MDELIKIRKWILENNKYYAVKVNTKDINGTTYSPHMAGSDVTLYKDSFINDILQKITDVIEKEWRK